MSKQIISTVAALALSAIVAPASAEVSGAVYGKGVGALTFETIGTATSPAAVRRQGGFATAGAVEWKQPSGNQSDAFETQKPACHDRAHARETEASGPLPRPESTPLPREI